LDLDEQKDRALVRRETDKKMIKKSAKLYKTKHLGILALGNLAKLVFWLILSFIN
jgi:hypothetical protein